MSMENYYRNVVKCIYASKDLFQFNLSEDRSNIL